MQLTRSMVRIRKLTLLLACDIAKHKLCQFFFVANRPGNVTLKSALIAQLVEHSAVTWPQLEKNHLKAVTERSRDRNPLGATYFLRHAELNGWPLS